MEYVKSRLTWRVPVDEQLAVAVLQSTEALAELGGRQVTVDLNGADLLGAVDDVWVDTRTDGGQTLVFELDVHTAVRMDGAGELVGLAMPADAPPALEWDCMVCGRTRPDAAISVTHRRLAVMPDAFPDTRVNVRHCNDDPSCISLAAVASRWGAAPVADAPELEARFAGACPFLTCTAMEPHSHPTCRSCGAVRYGNLSCPECREKRPAMERREAELGWFPGRPAAALDGRTDPC